MREEGRKVKNTFLTREDYETMIVLMKRKETLRRLESLMTRIMANFESFFC